MVVEGRGQPRHRPAFGAARWHLAMAAPQGGFPFIVIPAKAGISRSRIYAA
jgi:hypothetical protein